MDAKEMIVWIVGLVLAAMVVASPVACTMRRHQVVAEAIRNGADPIDAKCAVEGDIERSPMCILAATRVKK
jgi:hypothetical protein